MIACILAAAAVAATPAQPAEPAEEAARLEQLQADVDARLRASPWGEPLYVASVENDRFASGDVYALLPHPFQALRDALREPAQWCELLMLHLNVKRCESGPARVTLYLGAKHRQPLEQAYRLKLAYQVQHDTDRVLLVTMHAPSGPLGTQDYQLLLEAGPAGAQRSFVHFEYQVGYGLLAHLVMRGYFMTAGEDKVGFSLVQPPEGGVPRLVDGTRGAVERNAMRYHLALAAYLDSLSVPEDKRLERRLRDWFAATERYPRQLHEVNLDDYLAMKRVEAQP